MQICNRQNSLIHEVQLSAWLASVLLVSVVSWMSPSVVLAQGGNQSLLEEVVVTATKRAESVQDVAVAISAYTSEQLDVLGVSESGDIASFTPNFTWHTEFGRASPQPNIRGVGTNNFNANNTGPVAVYNDNVFIGPNGAQGFATFDIERVEVLKGPQGTLYGRNATAGAINFITRKPEIGEEMNGYVRGEVGEHGTTNGEAAFGMSLSDTVAFRVAGIRNYNTGVFDNENPLSNKSDGRIDDWAVRGQARFQPNNELDVLANIHFARSTPDTFPFKNVGLNCAPGVVATLPGDCLTDYGYGFTEQESPDFHTTRKSNDHEDVTAGGGLLEINYDISDSITLYSLSAYDQARLERFDDVDDQAIVLEFDHFVEDYTFYSQELRLSGVGSRTKWHVGAYYYFEESDGLTVFDNPDPNYFGFGYGNYHDRSVETIAGFAQMDFDITEQLTISGGLRYTNEQVDVDRYVGFLLASDNFVSAYQDLADINIVTSTEAAPKSDSFNKVTWRVSLNYLWSDDVMTYISHARGFKGGDINGAVMAFGLPFEDPVPTEVHAQFEEEVTIAAPEILDAVEVGIKSTWLDGALRLNSSFFYYRYKDQQNTVLTPSPVNPIGVTLFVNAGEANYPGAEIDINWLPTERLFFSAGYGFADAKYDEFIADVSLGLDFAGNHTALGATHSGTFLARYEFPIANGALSIQGDMTWQTRNYFQAQNQRILSEDALALFGARVAYVTDDGRLSVAVYAKNLGKKDYLTSGFDVSGFGWYATKPGNPRYIGAEIQYNFGGG